MILKKDIKNVFITGGAGFIGSHFADIFVKENLHVTVFDNLSTGKKIFLSKCIGKANFKFVKGDLLHPSQIKNSLSKNTDIVFHIAANPDISKGFMDPSIDFKQTIIATFNLLQEIRNKKIKKLIYFSGSGIYGDVGDALTNENYGPLQPVSMYGATKLSVESIISAFSNLYGIQSWIFRPANIIGDRATHGVVLDFINKLRKNPLSLTILGDGKQTKSYVYISDLVDAVLLTLQKSNNKINVFNISSSSFITVNEIADLVINGMRLKNVEITHTSGKIGWPGDIPTIRINNEKLKKLGWKEKYSSENAIKKTIKDILLFDE